MLIHEIYRRNVEERRGVPVQSSRPFKIVYAVDKIEADSRPFEAFYGALSSEEAEGLLFRYLGMPVSTSSTAPPLAIGGPRESRPYVEFWGIIRIDGKGVTITIGDKIVDGEISGRCAVVSLDATSGGKPDYNPSQKSVQLKALSGYSAGGKSLEDAYKKSAMFEDSDGFVLPKKHVKGVCSALFGHIVPKLQKYISETDAADTDRKRTKAQSMSFKVFVLPTRDAIKWDVPESMKRPSSMFVDVFGNESYERAPSKPTFTTKFLSTNNKEFTIKCRTNESSLYDDLNLSKKAYMQINLHDEDLFMLSGLSWYFGTDVDAKKRKRQPREDETGEQVIMASAIKSHGFYAQIRDMAEAEWDDHRIMCLKRDKNKVEVILNEHCPLAVIKKKLLKDSNGRLRYCPMTLETLIVKDKQKVDWGLYMESVRALLHGRKIARRRIVARLTSTMRKKMRGEYSARDMAKFFRPGLFCLEAIADGGGDKFAGLEDDEHFAHCVGQAAMHFALLRAGKNPTRDALLTRPVYDRATLRAVLSKVVSGLALRLDDPKAAAARAKCARAISWAAEYEIPDRNSRANLSYFFHAGAFDVIRNSGKVKGVEESAGAG